MRVERIETAHSEPLTIGDLESGDPFVLAAEPDGPLLMLVSGMPSLYESGGCPWVAVKSGNVGTSTPSVLVFRASVKPSKWEVLRAGG